MKSPILGAAYVARSINAADNRLVNLYPEATPDGGKTAAYFQRVPGVAAVTIGGTGNVRGMWAVNNRLFYVAYLESLNDSLFIELSSNTVWGSGIAGTGPVSMVDNGQQIFIATNPNGYVFNLNTNVFAQIGDPDFPGAVTVGYVDGYFVFNEPNSARVWVTALYDGASVDRKSTRLNSSHSQQSRMPSSA